MGLPLLHLGKMYFNLNRKSPLKRQRMNETLLLHCTCVMCLYTAWQHICIDNFKMQVENKTSFIVVLVACRHIHIGKTNKCRTRWHKIDWTACALNFLIFSKITVFYQPTLNNHSKNAGRCIFLPILFYFLMCFNE